MTNEELLNNAFASKHHRKLLGPNLYIEDSMLDYRHNECYCGAKDTPKYVAFVSATGAWICGHDECIQFYIITHMDRTSWEK